MKETIYAKAFRLGQRADSPEPLNNREWCELAYPLEDHAREMIERSFHKGYTASQASYAAALAAERREAAAQRTSTVEIAQMFFTAPADMFVFSYDDSGNRTGFALLKGQKFECKFNGLAITSCSATTRY